jgi:putative addiction module component (TIGR02574 family)
MSMSKQEILEQVKGLTADEQAELAEDLRQLAAVPLSTEQLREMRRRSDAVDHGVMQTLPGEQVIRELRERPRT